MNKTIKDTMSPEARKALTDALVRIRTLKAQLKGQHLQPIAIVGGAGRFPGAPNLDAYWDMCCTGTCAIDDIPRSRFHAPDLPTRAGLLDRVDGFDHTFFGLSPAEVRMMDPQHRLMLEVSWEAFEAARIPPSRHADATGVFVGIMTSDYSDIATTTPDTYTGPGNVACFSAGRISHVLGLQGPSMCLDTACSSSLVTVHLACQSLRSKEIDLAIAGGSTLILSESIMELMTRTGALSSSGESSVFDEKANGYVRGEGCAMVVLKRLDDALRDGDAIWAVIRGSAVNHDGRSSTLTAPSPERQEEVVREALRRSGVDAHQLGYIEAHGTGTALGDPIELDGLTRVLGQAQGCDGHCYVGSGKANTGHLEAAAGVTGLLRAAHVLRHGIIPPQANFSELNPRISLRGSTLRINTELRKWHSAHTKYAGVSAFGMSGTNAHVILEEPPQPSNDSARSGQIFKNMLAISAQSKDALELLKSSYYAHARQVDWEDLCCGAASRKALSYRQVIHASHTEEGLNTLTQPTPSLEPVPEHVQTTLVFGTSSTLSPELKHRLRSNHDFKTTLDACITHAQNILDLTPFKDDTPLARRVGHISLQLAMVAYLVDTGLQPGAVAGLGDGTLIAGILAGSWSLEDVLQHLHSNTPLKSSPTHTLLPAYLQHTDLAKLLTKLHTDGHQNLLMMGMNQKQNQSLDSLNIMSEDQRDEDVAHTLGTLYERGQIHHWDRVVGKASNVFSLPHYPWQRQSHWVGDVPEILSQPRWCYQEQWDAFEPTLLTQSTVIAIFGDTSERTHQVIRKLEARGHRVILAVDDAHAHSDPHIININVANEHDLYTLTKMAVQIHGAPIQRMIHLPWFGTSDGKSRQNVLMHLGKTQKALDCAQWFVTQGALDAIEPQHAKIDAPLWGMARAFFFESNARGGIVDIAHVSAPWVDACLAISQSKPLQLRADEQGLKHAVLRSIDASQNTEFKTKNFDPDASYLVTGGTGGIGRRLVNWLISRGATHIHVTSRRQPSEAVQSWIDKANTSGVTIQWHGVDVSNKEQMQHLFSTLCNISKPLKGIAHVAGVGSQTTVDTLNFEELNRVCAPKLDGGWLLHELSQGMDLEFFLGFSSISSVLAGQGQAAYSAANHALDALIRHRQNTGLPGCSIRWGLWDGEGIPDEQERLQFDMLGLHAMDGQRALNLLDRVFHEHHQQLIIASIDWAKCMNLLDPQGDDLLLQALRAHTEQPSPTTSKESEQTLSKEHIHTLIVEQVAQHVEVHPDVLPYDRSLTHLGLDSLGGYSLHGILKNAGINLKIEDMLGGATLEQLIAYALEHSTPVSPVTPTSNSTPEPVANNEPTPTSTTRAFHLDTVTHSEANQWFVNHTPERSGSHRLICFPYAGGNPSVFGGWARHIPEHVELFSLQLPARGARLSEAPVHEMHALIDELVKAYKQLGDNRPTSFFGHCFGALMMFELTDRLRSEGLELPQNLFVSAARNPRSYTHEQLMADVEQFSPKPPLQLPQLDDDMLVEALKEMRFADSVDALEKEEIRRLLLPAVRADFQISNTYFYEEKEPFNIPIFAMGGRADGYVTATQLLSWRHHTTAGFAHEYCSGGHYFIGAERDRWITRILERINKA